MFSSVFMGHHGAFKRPEPTANVRQAFLLRSEGGAGAGAAGAGASSAGAGAGAGAGRRVSTLAL